MAPFFGQQISKAAGNHGKRRSNPSYRSQREAKSDEAVPNLNLQCRDPMPLGKASGSSYYASRIATKRRQEEGGGELFNGTASDDGWTSSGRPVRQVDETVRERSRANASARTQIAQSNRGLGPD